MHIDGSVDDSDCPQLGLDYRRLDCVVFEHADLINELLSVKLQLIESNLLT